MSDYAKKLRHFAESLGVDPSHPALIQLADRLWLGRLTDIWKYGAEPTPVEVSIIEAACEAEFGVTPNTLDR